jgi:putative transposase
MPAPKRQHVAPTDDWQQLRLHLDWPEQITYELIRPVVIFGRSVVQRAKETGTSVRTIRRKADRHFARATTWEELLAVHDRWLEDFNTQVHWAHQEREDGRRSPAEVLGWVAGAQHTREELHRIFYTTRFGRQLDRLCYVRFRHWRIYGEQGVAKRQAAVWLYGDLLTVEFADAPLSQYLVTYAPNHVQLRTVAPLRQFETPHRSPQMPLWDLQPHEWQLALSLPTYARRLKRPSFAVQGRLAGI